MDDDGWDLQAVVRSCATVSSAVAPENTPAAMDVHGDGCDQPLPTTTSTAPITLISFDEGQSTHEQPSTFSNTISFSMKPLDSEHHARKRKVKNNKRVVEMREEELRNDGWAWRKYGQKKIKGSTYPRCSLIKDCSAKKQVERSLVNASSFIVSYTGDHLHPRPTHLSSLSGTTRSARLAADLFEQPPCSSSSPASTSSFSPATSLKEDETDQDF